MKTTTTTTTKTKNETENCIRVTKNKNLSFCRVNVQNICLKKTNTRIKKKVEYKIGSVNQSPLGLVAIIIE